MKIMRAGICLAVVTAAVLPAQALAATKTVKIKDIDFSAKTTTIKRGDSVTWRFLDGPTSHNVTSRGKLKFKSSKTMQRGAYTVRFNKAGTYNYVCTLHFNMKAKVVVK